MTDNPLLKSWLNIKSMDSSFLEKWSIGNRISLRCWNRLGCAWWDYLGYKPVSFQIHTGMHLRSWDPVEDSHLFLSLQSLLLEAFLFSYLSPTLHLWCTRNFRAENEPVIIRILLTNPGDSSLESNKMNWITLNVSILINADWSSCNINESIMSCGVYFRK